MIIDEPADESSKAKISPPVSPSPSRPASVSSQAMSVASSVQRKQIDLSPDVSPTRRLRVKEDAVKPEDVMDVDQEEDQYEMPDLEALRAEARTPSNLIPLVARVVKSQPRGQGTATSRKRVPFSGTSRSNCVYTYGY